MERAGWDNFLPSCAAAIALQSKLTQTGSKCLVTLALRGQPDLPSRSEAIRRLIETGLKAESSNRSKQERSRKAILGSRGKQNV
jgi:hypothetical protein